MTGHNSPNSTTYHYFFYNLKMKENCISNFTEATAVFILPTKVDNNIKNIFSIYPNPATNSIVISNSESIDRVEIYDIKGGLIFRKSYQKKSTSIDLSNFANGVYIVKVLSIKNTSVQKLIIE